MSNGGYIASDHRTAERERKTQRVLELARDRENTVRVIAQRVGMSLSGVQEILRRARLSRVQYREPALGHHPLRSEVT